MTKEEQIKQIFEEVYTILLVHLRASPGQRDDFVAYHLRSHGDDMPRVSPTEWRFCGALGMGGKFWAAPESFYVSCYKEDSGPAIRSAMKDVNEALEPLHQRWFDLCLKVKEEERNHE